MLKEVAVTREKQEVSLCENVKGGTVLNATTVKLRHDGDALYLTFRCYDDYIVSRGHYYNDRLYDGDVAELFITLGAHDKYLELEANPDGYRFAAIISFEGGNRLLNPLDTCPFTSRNTRLSDGWRTEWRIPLLGLKELGFDPDNAEFNLYRQDFRADGSLMLYALNPTLSTTFHRPDAFIRLRMEF